MAVTVRPKYEAIACVTGLLFFTLIILRNISVSSKDVLATDFGESITWKEDKNYLQDFKYIREPGMKFCETVGLEPFLLIMVASAIPHRHRRDAIRESWGSERVLRREHAKLVFLLGTNEESNQQSDSLIHEEFDEYGDIIQQNFIDSYQNLTLKSLAALKWTSFYCNKVKFLMKTDDDMYVNIPLLTNHLSHKLGNEGGNNVITGCIKNGPMGAPQPISISGAKFKTPHPPFTAGAGYVISMDLVTPLFIAATRTRLIRVEDAFITGHLAEIIGNVDKQHNSLFSCGQQVARDCDMKRTFTGHKITPERMKRIHTQILNNNC